MKVYRIFFAFLFIGLIFSSTGYSQYFEQYECGTNINPKYTEYAMSLTQLGGKYITADRTFRILIVFASYPDDINSHPYWPVGGPPTYMANFIDPDENTNSTNHANLTNYFGQMSFDTYNMIGEAIHVQSPHTKAWYDSMSYGRGATIKDVLQNAVDPLIDFSEYDNWTRVSDYDHVNEPDGVVDMIVVVWRGFQFGVLGEASLGYVSSVTLDGVQIKFGYPNGSGCYVSYTYNSWPSKAAQHMIHETGHWLLGGFHPYGNKYNVWSILGTQFAAGICANAFERERLGWINVTEIDESINAPLSDYITTGVAYKYHPPNGATDEWYYIENHQKISIYDDATKDSNDKGVWIIHQQGPYINSENIRIKPTDGLWDWENPYYTSQCFSTNLPAFRKLNVNANESSLSHRDQLPTNPVGDDWMHVFIDEESEIHCAGFFKGHEMFDGSYNLNTSTVFSPWSNPGAKTWNNNLTDFAMEILSQSGSVVNVHFYVGDAVNAPPAKILDLTLTASANDHPYLTWTGNSEPDVTNYQIYKKKDSPDFVLHATIPSTQTYYEDLSETVLTGPPQANETIVYYRIKGVDSQGKNSPYSNEVNSRVEGSPLERISSNPDDDSEYLSIPDNYELLTNYPNPFNPSTTIAYTLPKAQPVKLTIYSLSGQEVITLINNFVEKGYHHIQWNGKDAAGRQVASGIYLYRLKAGGKNLVKKMMLVK